MSSVSDDASMHAVQIKWKIDMSANNRSPRGNTFSTVAKFEHQGSEWNNDAWSLIIESRTLPDSEGRQDVLVRFLAPDAPHEWLEKGRKFELYEGSRLIAEGRIT